MPPSHLYVLQPFLSRQILRTTPQQVQYACRPPIARSRSPSSSIASSLQSPILSSLALLMLRVQRADDIHMSLSLLSSLPPNRLYLISFRPSNPYLHLPQSHPGNKKKSRKRTLHPSQSFFTELLTFIPLTCSIATSAVFTTTAAVGLVVAAVVFANATDESARVGATHLVRDGRSALRAERRRRGSIVGLV